VAETQACEGQRHDQRVVNQCDPLQDLQKGREHVRGESIRLLAFLVDGERDAKRRIPLRERRAVHPDRCSGELVSLITAHLVPQRRPFPSLIASVKA
jgi:hypothetical protein